jgi:hypothetical protein
VAITELTNQGDNLDFRSTDTLWSGFSGKTPTITPNGLYDGAAIIPAVSASDNVIDIAEGRVYIAGVLTTISADTDITCARPTVSDYVIYSVQAKSDGTYEVIKGTEGSGFSETRAAAGGPPLITATSSEIGWVKYDSQVAAAIAADEIKSIEGTSLERFDGPTWNVKYKNVSNGILGYAGILFTAALPAIHTGPATKDVYASWHTPSFAELNRAYDWKPPALSISVNSTAVYSDVVGAVNSSVGAGTFSALTQTNIHDNILRVGGKLIWFKYFQDRLETSRYQVSQGHLAVDQDNPAGDNISISCTLGAESVADMVYA